ncbi:MAG: hypothetical protein AB7I36_20625 [Rhodospirillaceae bacterium]
MADSPSAILLQRLQSVGSNVNLWGNYINTDLQMLEQASKGYQSLAVTGDATISWTNYATGNTGAAARLKLTGSPAAACALTFPAFHNFLSVENATPVAVTIKCSGGTGVIIAAGAKALIYCDSVDYHNAGPTIGPPLVQSTNIYAYAQWGAVETAIANASVPASSGAVLNSLADTAAGYHAAKHTVTFALLTTTQVSGLTSFELSTQNPGGSEKLLATVGNGYVGGFLNGGKKAAAFTPAQGNAYDVDTSSGGFTIDLGSMTDVQLGHEIDINKFGTNNIYLKGTVNGAADLSLGAFFHKSLRYCGTSWGWNLEMSAPKQILRGTITISGSGSNTATISVSNTAKCELRYLGSTTNSAGLDVSLIHIVLTNTTTITATRNTTSGAPTVSWELTEFY